MSDIKQYKASFSNPFNLDDDEIREFLGDATPAELRCVRAVLNGIRDRLHHTNLHNGMTHSELCWSWGPVHYACAYNKVVEMCRKRPAMDDMDILQLCTESVDFEDARRIVRAVELHHHIGGAR